MDSILFSSQRFSEEALANALRFSDSYSKCVCLKTQSLKGLPMNDLDLTLFQAKSSHEEILLLAEQKNIPPNLLLSAYLMGIRAVHHLLPNDRAAGFRDQLMRFVHSLEATKPSDTVLKQLGL
jgi:hypothetical protein